MFRYALRSELSWTHYRLIMRVDDPLARSFYIKKARECGWSSRVLERQITTCYYERLLSSRIKAIATGKPTKFIQSRSVDPEDFIKDPYALDFLSIKESGQYHEKDIEQAILNQLQKFLLELGRGFSFVSRQYRISSESNDFYIDLVFYNYILKCFV